MNLFIRIKNGVPFEHPIFEDNFREAFPDIDINNLPEGFKRFERVPDPPAITVYQKLNGVTYEAFGDVIRDVWHVVDMTESEKIELQNSIKAQWANEGFASWSFNAETCSFDPPVAYPTDGNVYKWNESILNWVEIARITTTESGSAPDVIG